MDPRADKYPPGTVVRGKVVSLKDYGAFIELEEGIEGLVHISEMSWTRRVKHPSKVVAVGDTVEAVVLDIDPRQNRISLGIKQLEPNPFASLKEKYPPGTVVKGVVRNIADFGIFVEIEEGIDGLVHVSDLSWTQRVKHPSELYQKGDEVESVVLNIDFDGEKPKVSLGIKQLVPDPWDRIPYDYPPGKIVEAKVIKVLDFGAFVEIEKGVEGLIHVSEFSEERIEDPKTFVKPGQILKAEIIGVDTAERKIGLSFRGATRAEELADAQGFSSGVPTATLGDVMRDKLAKLTGKTADEGGEQPPTTSKQQEKKNKKAAKAAAAEAAAEAARDRGRDRTETESATETETESATEPRAAARKAKATKVVTPRAACASLWDRHDSGVAHVCLAPPVREALGLRAVLRLHRLHLPGGRPPVPVRDPGRVHPRAAGRPRQPPQDRQPPVSAGGGRDHPVRQHPRGAGAVHQLLRAEAIRRLRAAVPRSAAAVRQGQQGLAAARGRVDRRQLRRRGDRRARRRDARPQRATRTALHRAGAHARWSLSPGSGGVQLRGHAGRSR